MLQLRNRRPHCAPECVCVCVCMYTRVRARFWWSSSLWLPTYDNACDHRSSLCIHLLASFHSISCLHFARYPYNLVSVRLTQISKTTTMKLHAYCCTGKDRKKKTLHNSTVFTALIQLDSGQENRIRVKNKTPGWYVGKNDVLRIGLQTSAT